MHEVHTEQLQCIIYHENTMETAAILVHRHSSFKHRLLCSCYAMTSCATLGAPHSLLCHSALFHFRLLYAPSDMDGAQGGLDSAHHHVQPQGKSAESFTIPMLRPFTYCFYLFSPTSTPGQGPWWKGPVPMWVWPWERAALLRARGDDDVNLKSKHFRKLTKVRRYGRVRHVYIYSFISPFFVICVPSFHTDLEDSMESSAPSPSTSSAHIRVPCFSMYELRHKHFSKMSNNAVYAYTYKHQIKSLKTPSHWVREGEGGGQFVLLLW